MNRRNFLKILALGSLSATIAPLSTFARVLPKKILMAIKAGKYPGKIKSINDASIQKEGKWLG